MNYLSKIKNRIEKINQIILAQDSSDKYLEIKDPTKDEKILIYNGIKPLRFPGESSSLLGSGSRGSVYRVLYENKMVAAKIAHKNTKGDSDNFIELQEIIEKESNPNMKERIKKIFPSVLKIIKDAPTEEYSEHIWGPNKVNQRFTDIIIFELLEPMPKESRESLDSSRAPKDSNTFFESIYYVIKENINYKLSSLIMKFELSSSNKDNISDEISKDLIKHLYNKTEPNFDNLSEEVLNKYFSDKLNFKEIKDYLSQSIRYVFQIYKDKASVTLPFDPGDPREVQWKEQAETKEIFEVLDYLARAHNYNYADLSSENIMMRPGTNDLVISDIGEFSIQKEGTMDFYNKDVFLNKLRRKNLLLKKRKISKEKTLSILTKKAFENEKLLSVALELGMSPAFLEAVINISGLKLDYYFPFSFKQNKQAIDAANNLDFSKFVEVYFGEHFLKKGLDEKLKSEYEQIQEKYNNN